MIFRWWDDGTPPSWLDRDSVLGVVVGVNSIRWLFRSLSCNQYLKKKISLGALPCFLSSLGKLYLLVLAFCVGLGAWLLCGLCVVASLFVTNIDLLFHLLTGQFF